MEQKNTLIISYDINKSDEFKYEIIYEYIKSFKTWAKITESTWAILTDKKTSEVRTEIQSILPSKSRIFVIKSAGVAAWSNVIATNEWLKKHI